MHITVKTVVVGSVCGLYSLSLLAMEPAKFGELTFLPVLEFGVAGIYQKNQAFGSKSSFYGYPIDKDGDRVEGYAKYGMGFSFPLVEDKIVLSGKVSAISALTRGNSDGLGYTYDNPTDTDWEDGYLDLTYFNLLGFDSIGVSYGRQNFSVSNGFLISEGHVDQGHEAGYWLGARKAFDNAFIVRVNRGSWHFDGFSLKTKADVDAVQYKERIEINGGNAQYDLASGGHLGFMHLEVTDDQLKTRDGLDVSDVRMINISIPGVEQLKTSAEYVWQENSNIKSHSWYAGATYTFFSAPWAPDLTYRYSAFSKNYDSLLYGYGGDLGTWVQGEIVGNSMLFNTNQRTSMIKFGLHPSEALTAGIAYYDFSFYGKPEGVSHSEFAKETNLFIDWVPNNNVAVGAVMGMGKPGEGAKEYLGSNSTSYLFETYFIYSF
ncbi:hypothetical protein [Pseudomonas sp. C32]|jgi:hypothetical protein|uniref:hypothetical protein n=1 Tax=Pseudomonas sp. C32 TaxID=1529208 RepID=UPI00262FA2AC|nr:hypothetical protein [Pseudomonas sp. C32]MDN4546784.1 hypothetical protein [Pseudomonas sp. C32]